ncbi:uncharacterized protein [Antedon mediterranea]|uniref:uncharacterized protein n=1 Tax=Antedon mediterranea TaxID=105859 RepID=UPI003AF57B21
MAEFETNQKFTNLKFDLGRHFNGDRLLWLKFCLFEHLHIEDLTKLNVIGNDFFNELHATGKITPNNVSLLLEITKLCELKKAEDLVVQYIRDNNAEKTEEKISPRRKFMFKKLRNVDPDALKRVIAHYDLARYNYTNIWDVTFRLETGQLLSKEPDKKDVFSDLLRQIVHHDNVPQRSGSHKERRKDEYDDSKSSGSNRRPEGNIESDDDKCVAFASKRRPEGHLPPRQLPPGCLKFETNQKFTNLKFDLGRHFDGDRLLWLKFCLFEHLHIEDLTKLNVIGNDFFNELHATGKITPNNVSLLLEITKLCELKKAEDLVVQYIRNDNAKNTEEKISPRRKYMFKKLRNVDPDALKRVIAHYDLARYNYTNIWDVTFRLETGQLLSKEPDKKDVFDDLLRQIVHHDNVPQRSGSHKERRKDEYDDSKSSGSNRRPEGNIESDDDKCVAFASKRRPEGHLPPRQLPPGCLKFETNQKFTNLKFDLGRHFDGDRLLWLKFCLFEHLHIEDLTKLNVIGNDFFNELHATGKITPNNVSLLLEITKLCELKKAEDLVVQYIRNDNAKNTEEKISPRRKYMFKKLRNVDPDALKRVIAHYDLARYNYTNIWDVTFRLETGQLLSKEPDKKDVFDDLLRQIVHHDNVPQRSGSHKERRKDEYDDSKSSGSNRRPEGNIESDDDKCVAFASKRRPEGHLPPRQLPPGCLKFETNQKFTNLKFDLGRHFDGDRLLWLKFCLFEHLHIEDLTKLNVIGNDFFNELHATGKITPNNVSLLLEITKLCELKKAEDLVVQYIRNDNAKNTEEKISLRRKYMFKKLRNVDPDALKRVIAHYDLARYNYTNIWDVTFRLETGQLLSKEPDKKDVFSDLLRQIVHHDNVPQRSGSHKERRKDEYDDSKSSGSNRRPEGNIESDDDKCVAFASKRRPEDLTPVEIQARGPEAIRAYNEALEEGETEVKQGRVIFVGLEGVGKTSTINALLRKGFNPKHDITDAIATTVCTQDDVDETTLKEIRDTSSNMYEKAIAREVVKQVKGKQNTTASTKQASGNYENAPMKHVKEDRIEEQSKENPAQSTKTEESKMDEEQEKHQAKNPSKIEIEFQKEVSGDQTKIPSKIEIEKEESDDQTKIPSNIKDFIEFELQKSDDKTTSDKFVMKIWDFGGQPIYHVMQRIFMVSFAVICVVFNLCDDLDAPAKVLNPTTGQTYLHRMTNLEFILSWIRSIYTNSRPDAKINGQPCPPVLLIGTHLNGLQGNEAERKRKLAEIKERIWQALKDKPYAAMVFSTIFTIENSVPFAQSNASVIMKHILDFSKKMIRTLPIKWLRGQQEIQSLKKEHIYLQASKVKYKHENNRFKNMLMFY